MGDADMDAEDSSVDNTLNSYCFEALETEVHWRTNPAISIFSTQKWVTVVPESVAEVVAQENFWLA